MNRRADSEIEFLEKEVKKIKNQNKELTLRIEACDAIDRMNQDSIRLFEAEVRDVTKILQKERNSKKSKNKTKKI